MHDKNYEHLYNPTCPAFRAVFGIDNHSNLRISETQELSRRIKKLKNKRNGLPDYLL